MNKLDLFENLIKKSAEAHEMPYEASAWSDMTSKLDASSTGGSSSGLNTIAACLSGVIIVGGLATLGNSLKQSSNDHQNEATNTAHVTSFEEHAVVVEHKYTEVLVENRTDQKNATSEDSALPESHISKMEQASVVIYDENTKEETVVVVSDLKDQLKEQKEDIKNNTETSDKNVKIITGGLPDNIDVSENSANVLQDILPLPANATPCEGEKVEFDILMYSDKQTTEWDFGDGYISSSRNPAHVYEKAGTYTLTLKTRFKDNPDQVIEKTTKIEVLESPKVDFTIHTSDFAARPITTLESRNGNSNAVWTLSNGKKYTGSNAETIFNKKGSKTITLNQVAANGCEASKSKTIYVENDYNLLAPNSFTCNGDGRNDEWFPAALTQLDFAYELVILDKQGRTVYTTRTNRPWNGINNSNGESCATGFYVWYVKLTNDKNQVEEYKGSLYLNRN